ncbi:hypothetical protein [Aeromicrobium alkaliterrae]|uniref:PsbP C-terminal domain-containing protein n=1 Tax=Aeromicrobium alkaliterrae TaxID=302168 RepID=A0ABP4W0A3_9ACTN
MSQRRLLVLPTLLMAALLVGCGSDDSGGGGSSSNERGSTRTATPDVEEDEEDRVGTDDYTFVLPDGWAETSTSGTAADVAFVSGEAVDGFRTNVNIIQDTGPEMSVREFETQAIERLESEGFTGVAADDPYEVDGVESPVVRADVVSQGVTYQTRQYYAQYDGSYYIITFSFAPSASEYETKDVSQDVIDTWRWES